MSTRIEPTVGRVVWFTPSASDNIERSIGSPLAAIITAVLSDRCVNLVVFDFNGRAHGRTSIYLAQDGFTPLQDSFCEWMPYQKGQAAKTEAVTP